MPDEVRILLVEDNPDDAEMALRALGLSLIHISEPTRPY